MREAGIDELDPALRCLWLFKRALRRRLLFSVSPGNSEAAGTSDL